MQGTPRSLAMMLILTTPINITTVDVSLPQAREAQRALIQHHQQEHAADQEASSAMMLSLTLYVLHEKTVAGFQQDGTACATPRIVNNQHSAEVMALSSNGRYCVGSQSGQHAINGSLPALPVTMTPWAAQTASCARQEATNGVGRFSPKASSCSPAFRTP